MFPKNTSGGYSAKEHQILKRTLHIRFIASCIALFMAFLYTGLCAAESDTDGGFLSPSALEKQGFRPIFAGEDASLNAWNANETQQRHWKVVGSEIHYDGDNETLKWQDSNLWTKDEFSDVQLYVEWRFPAEPKSKAQPIVLWNGDFLLDESGKRITRMGLDAGDSGILFRGVLKCQANIWCQELGSGEVNGYRTDKKLPIRLRQSCLPFAVGDNPLGAWNSFLITLRESRLTVTLNGRDVLATEPLPDLPDRGPIGLQHHGDPIQFRNIWVKEIKEDE